MTGVIAAIPKFQFLSAAGAPMIGGTLTTYLAGSTTLAPTWQDQALTILNTNPIALDARGECVLWFDSATTYKLVLKNGVGVVQWTQDNLTNTAALVNALRAELAASSGASLVGWIRELTSAVATTLSKWLGWQDVSVFDFMTDAQIADVKARTLTLDVTAAVQAAINATTLRGEVLKLKGWMMVTDSLVIKNGTQIRGNNFFPSDWRVPGMPGTKLTLVTAAAKDLFTVDQAALDQGYVWGIHIGNLTLEGSNIATSRGMYLKNVSASVFENIGISKFGRGLEIEAGMMNEYNRVNASKCLDASYYLNGTGITTTQTFNQCVGRESPWAWIMESTATGNSIGTTLNGCLIESTTEGGVSQHRSCSAEYNGVYAENCPDDRVAPAGTMFSLFKNGVDVDPYRSVAVFNGGDLAGGNFGLSTDQTIIDIGSAKSVVVNGSALKRATNGIRWDLTTADNAIQLLSPNFTQVTNLYVGLSGKMVGIYPDNNLNAATPKLLANFWSLFLGGGQLQFPSIQNPSADPNTLDDYEEGIFTPVFSNLTVVNGTGGATFSGRYTAIGDLVTVSIRISTTGTCTTSSGTNTYTNSLPFPAARGAISPVVNTSSMAYVGTGVISGVSMTLPAWTATSNQIDISGSYFR